MTTCKNCSATFEGKYCPDCGQKGKTSRITFKQILKDLRDHFIHFDQGFLFTMRDLTLRPGDTIREYLEGKRVKHIKPLRYLFWSSAISFVFTQYINLEEKIFQGLEQEGHAVTDQKRQVAHKIMQWFESHHSIVMLFTIPTVSVCSWLFFRKKGFNYAEFFTANTYLMAQISLFSIGVMLIQILVPVLNVAAIGIIGTIQWTLWALYFGWSYSHLVQQPRKVSAWLKGIVVIFAGYSLLIILMSVIFATLKTVFHFELEQLFPAN